MEIAYYFEFDYADGRRDDDFAREAVELVRSWMAEQATGELTLEERDDGSLFLEDTRQTTTTRPADGVAPRVEGGGLPRLRPRADLPRARRAPRGAGRAASRTTSSRAFLGRCVDNRLMLAERAGVAQRRGAHAGARGRGGGGASVELAGAAAAG